MKKYFYLLGGLIMFIKSLKPFFEQETTKTYDILGIGLPKYLYIFIYFILGVGFFSSFFLEKKEEKDK